MRLDRADALIAAVRQARIQPKAVVLPEARHIGSDGDYGGEVGIDHRLYTAPQLAVPHAPLRAQWGVRYSELWRSIEAMVDADLPAIIAVGPNMPRFWQNNRLGLYTRLPDGSYKRIGAVKAHYMSVTAIDGEWLTVSSWGRRYCISRAEYDAYTRAYSNGLLCNIAYIKTL